MRPYSLSLVLTLALFLHPVASVCVPRNSTSTTSPTRLSPPPASPKIPPPFKDSPKPAPPTQPPAPPPTVTTTLTTKDPTTTPVNSMIRDVAEALSAAVHSAIGTGVLKPICDKTDYPDVCLSSIQSVASSLNTVNFQDAAAFQIKACAAKAQEAMDEARKFASESGYGDCLKDCLDNYDDALDNLEIARKALVSKDKGTVMSMLSATFDSFSCSDTFDEGKKLGLCEAESPLKAYEDVLTKMSSNSLAICEQLNF